MEGTVGFPRGVAALGQRLAGPRGEPEVCLDGGHVHPAPSSSRTGHILLRTRGNAHRLVVAPLLRHEALKTPKGSHAPGT